MLATRYAGDAARQRLLALAICTAAVPHTDCDHIINIKMALHTAQTLPPSDAAYMPSGCGHKAIHPAPKSCISLVLSMLLLQHVCCLDTC